MTEMDEAEKRREMGNEVEKLTMMMSNVLLSHFNTKLILKSQVVELFWRITSDDLSVGEQVAICHFIIALSLSLLLPTLFLIVLNSICFMGIYMRQDSTGL